MPADYDLVILGGALEGRLAAQLAAGYGARVALIEPPGLFAQRQQVRYLLQGLQQIARGVEQAAVVERFRLSGGQVKSDKDGGGFDWAALVQWSAIAAETQLPSLSPEALSASGVDFVFSMPERLAMGQVVSAANRTFKARAVLAAFGTIPANSAQCVTGLESVLNADQLPECLAVCGGSAQAITWAESFCSLGVKVSLVADELLPDEDGEVRWLVRSHLSASGIDILSSSDFAQLSDPSIPVVSLDRQKAALQLPKFIAAERQVSLAVNKTLQTVQPRVFACGAVNYDQPVAESVTNAEVPVAVWNALFAARKSVDYGAIAHSTAHMGRVGTTPSFAKVGRDPDKSEQAYHTWTANCANSADLHRVSPLPSFCKLISYRDRLQSIHLFGDGANELAQSLTWAIGRPVSDLSDSPLPTPSTALIQLVRTAAAQSNQSQWQPNNWRRDCAENWFNWRRSQK